MVLGLLKKFLIADYLAENLINRVFDLPKLYSGTEVLMGVYGYALQLYYDFSGYTDIAIGSALLLESSCPSTSIAPTPRKISPTSGGAGTFRFPTGCATTCISRSLACVRAGRFYVCKSGPHHGHRRTLAWRQLDVSDLGLVARNRPRGAALVAGAARKSEASPRIQQFAFLKGVVTFHFVLVGWIFFRASSLATARDVFSQIGSGTVSFANVAPGFLLVFGDRLCARTIFRKSWYDGSLRLYSDSPFYAQAAAMALLIVAIQYVGATGAVPFIYNRF